MANQEGKSLISRIIGVLVVVLLVVAAAIWWFEVNPINSAKSGKVKDEALAAGRTVETFPPADEHYLKDMDRGTPLTDLEIKGQNTWNIWTFGNDRFWNYMSNNTFGAFDLLKTLSNHPSLYYSRSNRWEYLGLINEPCFDKATGPVDEHYGLWLDVRREGGDCKPDPYANAEKYPGVKVGARGTNVPVGSYYGEPSGILGLRLFSNPDFDEEAEKKWDAKRYYEDPSYYNDKDLVRPYRVGMSCGFCHIGPSPVNPPEDPENPQFANLISNSGAQYFWVDRIFFWDNKPVNYGGDAADNERNFVFQLFHTNKPGALDTSFISTDNINNPRTMNAVYDLPARVEIAKRFGKATLKGGSNNNKQFGDYPQTESLSGLYDDPEVVAPHILKDGADSVGVLGALNRVYLNIGLFSEEWLTHFRALVGGQRISPIEISVMEKNSTYWNATVDQNANVALFFLKTAKPDRLAEVGKVQESGAVVVPEVVEEDAIVEASDQAVTEVEEALEVLEMHADTSKLDRGKVVFAENCAMCHSSKLPDPVAEVEGGICEGGGNGPQYLECWEKYFEWAKSDAFKAPMREIVAKDDFLDGNYLSTDRRIPVTLLKTNACSPLATNGIADNIWDNFTSETYKQLPAVGSIEIKHPLTGEASQYEMPGDGRGYTRPPSLISLWSTAPYLLNNSVGNFDSDPSVEARVAAFEDGMTKMLWPEKRLQDADIMEKIGLPRSAATPNLDGYIYRTTAASCLKIPNGYLPLPEWLSEIVLGEDGLEVGPIPKGTPVNLLSNIQILPETNNPFSALGHRINVLRLVKSLKRSLKENGLKGVCTDEALDNMDKQGNALDIYMKNDVAERLIAVSKCPDYEVNSGHYFGTSKGLGEGLSDADKYALIEFLKTF